MRWAMPSAAKLGHAARSTKNFYAREENGWAISEYQRITISPTPEALAIAERAAKGSRITARAETADSAMARRIAAGPFLGDTLAMGQAFPRSLRRVRQPRMAHSAAKAGEFAATFPIGRRLRDAKTRPNANRRARENLQNCWTTKSSVATLHEPAQRYITARKLSRAGLACDDALLRAAHQPKMMLPGPACCLADEELPPRSSPHMTIVGQKEAPRSRDCMPWRARCRPLTSGWMLDLREGK